jgi:cysteine-rich repeat protein
MPLGVAFLLGVSWGTMGCGPSAGDGNDNANLQNQNNGNGNQPPDNCGNGQIDPGEQCDDGNTEDCDGCSPTCQLETGPCCGNSLVETGEECDDGNTEAGDGCDELCRLEICGNGRLDASEQCDDGNTTPGDGCNQLCLHEECGNDVMDVGEDCDGTDFQGVSCADFDFYEGTLSCDASCLYDTSTCVGRCGDGDIDVPEEECDDGNTDAGDGCDDQCLGEPGACLVDQDLGTLSLGGTLTTTVTTTGSHDLVDTSCSSGNGREIVVSFTLGEYLDVTIDWANQTGNHVLGIFRDQGGACDEAELDCVDTAWAASGTAGPLTLGAGTWYVVVDAQDAANDGAVDLTLSAAASTLPCDTQFGDNGTYRGCVITSAFEDISASGSLAVASDDSYAEVPIGFSFDLYGQQFTDATLQTNGGITFDNGYMTLSNVCLPGGPAGPAIFTLWDDLDSGNGGDGVYYETRGTAPNRRFIAQWVTDRYSSTPQNAVFQAVLHEGTNHLEIRYQNVDFGSSSYDFGANATVGIQESSTTGALEYSCNSATVTNGLSLVFYRL